MTGAVALLLAVAVWFLATHDYTRKTTVPGLVESRDAVKYITLPRTGTISELYVSAGDHIAAEAPIAAVAVPSSVNESERLTLLGGYDRRLAAIDDRRRNVISELSHQDHAIRSERVRLAQTLANARETLKLQLERIAQAEATNKAAFPLYESGQLSRIEWGKFRDALLGARQQAEHLATQVSELEDQQRQSAIRIEQLETGTEARLLELQEQSTRLRQERARLMQESGFTLRAPIAGTVASLSAQVGSTLSAGQPLATLQPPGSALHARLLVPARSAGFIAKGHKVSLLIDAFPYQQFGTPTGEVVRVSPHAFLPGRSPTALDVREPYFEAFARLDSDSVLAYGSEVPIRSGMTLRASIIQDNRSLAEWLLEPLFAIGKRP